MTGTERQGLTKDRTTFLLEQAEIELRDGLYFEVKGDDLRIVVEALKRACPSEPLPDPVATLRLLAKCGSMDLSALDGIADEFERLDGELEASQELAKAAMADLIALRKASEQNATPGPNELADMTAQRDHWLEIAREKDSEIERLQKDNQLLRSGLDKATSKVVGMLEYKPMFEAAVRSIAEISAALGIPEEAASTANGNEEILAVLEELVHRVKTELPPHAHEPGEQRPGTILKAFDVIREKMRDDPEYAWSWHCNIAMPIMDTAKVSHELANKAAAHLMQHLFAIDTRDNQHYQYRAALKSGDVG